MGPTHLRPGHLSTIVSPGEQSQVREGGSCHDPRPTDGGHGNPFSFSGKWAGPAQARGLHTENVDPGPQVAQASTAQSPGGSSFKCSTRKPHHFQRPTEILEPTRVSSIALQPSYTHTHTCMHTYTHTQAGHWQCEGEVAPPLGGTCDVTALLHLLSLLTRRSDGLGVQRLGHLIRLCWWLPREPGSDL